MNIQIGESLADSELLKFTAKNDRCTFVIKLWNEKVIELFIDEVLYIEYNIFYEISGITEERKDMSECVDANVGMVYNEYQFFDCGGDVRLTIIGSAYSTKLITSDWAGHWIFNTNETNLPGAYQRMFARNVAAIYGYANGPRKLQQGAEVGDRVFAYVNQQGLRAIGTVVEEEVVPGAGVFVEESGEQRPGEFHLKVRWDVIVPPECAITPAQARKLGCTLPVRSTFGKLRDGKSARVLEHELYRLGSNKRY